MERDGKVHTRHEIGEIAAQFMRVSSSHTFLFV